MRELILKMSISIDGFVSDPDRRNAWMFGTDQVAKDWSVEILATARLHVMGSRTFLGMASHWPTVTDGFAQPMNAIPKAVFTRQNPAVLRRDLAGMIRAGPGAESWRDAYVAAGDLSGEVARMKAQAGGPIIAHGGAGLARSLVACGLIDRFVLLVHPIALGAGLPLFSELTAPMPLTLTDSIAFPGGAVAQTYRTA